MQPSGGSESRLFSALDARKLSIFSPSRSKEKKSITSDETVLQSSVQHRLSTPELTSIASPSLHRKHRLSAPEQEHLNAIQLRGKDKDHRVLAPDPDKSSETVQHWIQESKVDPTNESCAVMQSQPILHKQLSTSEYEKSSSIASSRLDGHKISRTQSAHTSRPVKYQEQQVLSRSVSKHEHSTRAYRPKARAPEPDNSNRTVQHQTSERVTLNVSESSNSSGQQLKEHKLSTSEADNISSTSEDTSTSEDAPTSPSSSPSFIPAVLRKFSIPAFLARSSSYSVSAKSAPTTPQGDWSPGAGAPPSPVNPPPKSPSHSGGKHDKADKHGVKQLSTSAPGMTQAPRPQSAGEPAVSTTAAAAATTPVTPAPEEPGSSKSRQKKFHRHFKQVAHDERVLNYYSCALVADILLQGQLYITKNYFAFYSNVFGYVTKLLIPTEKVVKISKEKTARIIPNAVGVATEDEKHVFGSLLSRDSTYRLMTQVWKAAMGPEPLIVLPVIKDVADEIETTSGRFINLHEDDESSLSGSERSVAPTPTPTDISQVESLCTREISMRGLSAIPPKDKTVLRPSRSEMPRPTTLLLVSTALLVFLFLSAAFLLYRISLIQSQFIGNPLLSSSDQVYQEILKWQAQLHSRSANEVQEFLSSNLDQLTKVRKSLEALSLLLLRNEEYARTVRGRQQEYDTTFLRNGNS